MAIQLLEQDLEKAEAEKEKLKVIRDKNEGEEIDIQHAIKKVLYHMEHLEELLLDQANRANWAVYFNLLF